MVKKLIVKLLAISYLLIVLFRIFIIYCNNMKKELQSIIDQVSSKMGKNSLMALGETADTNIDVISTGSLALNEALGINGFPKGRIVEIYGQESSGKTTLCIHAIAECQKNGGICAVVDAEHAFDPAYATNLGVNIDDLLISQPDCGEDGLDTVEELVKTNQVDLIIVDSVSTLTPRSELEGNMGDSSMGVHARLMSQALRKLVAIVHKTKTCVIFINQIRMKIGVVFGNPETTTGGNALKFYSSMRLEIRKSTPLKKGEDVYGNKTKVKIVKNKLAPPFKKCEFDILYGTGIDYFGEILDKATVLGIVRKKGAWYKYNDSNIGQGRESTVNLLRDNPELVEELTSKF